MSYDELVERTWDLSDLMCSAADISLFTTVLVADEERRILAIKKAWAGKPDEESRAPRIGPTKALELLIDLGPDFAMTPCHPLGTGWMGGVRRRIENVHYITSGSAWAEKCDTMMALALNYAMEREVRFHHFGRRHRTPEALEEAVEADEKKLDSRAIYLPTGEGIDFHERYYLLVEEPTHPNGHYWLEHQYFPEGNRRKPAIHWDLATMNDFDLLSFVANAMGVKAITWEAGPYDPIGLVGETNRDGVIYQIMARDRWWEVKPE